MMINRSRVTPLPSLYYYLSNIKLFLSVAGWLRCPYGLNSLGRGILPLPVLRINLSRSRNNSTARVIIVIIIFIMIAVTIIIIDVIIIAIIIKIIIHHSYLPSLEQLPPMQLCHPLQLELVCPWFWLTMFETFIRLNLPWSL